MANYLKITTLVTFLAIIVGYFSLYPQTLNTVLKVTGLNHSLFYVHNKCLSLEWCRSVFSRIHGTPPPSSEPSIDPVEERIFSFKELEQFTGEGGSEVYIGLLGKVYNVTKGKQHYGPGGGYSFFAGRDASRAFVSGEFEGAGLNDDVEGLSFDDYIGLEDWASFYENTYQYIGKVVGRYYNADGSPTPYWYTYQQWRDEALKTRVLKDQEMQVFPPCNMEWNKEKGTRVWCTKASGGVTREWIGVPRKLFKSGASNSRCTCVRNSGPPTGSPDSELDTGDVQNPNIKEYVGCNPTAASCYVSEEDK